MHGRHPFTVCQCASPWRDGAHEHTQENCRKLCDQAVIVMERVLFAGGTIAIEWPTSCRYWHVRVVLKFIAKHKLQMANIYGCSFDARNSKGELVLKPLTKCTSSKSLYDRLAHRRCTRDHLHAEVHGRETPQSSRYPMELANLRHDEFKNTCQQ